MNHTYDRVAGSLIGLAVGDALGTTIEFCARDTYEPVTDIVGGGPFRLNPGDWTDDTSMALCLAQSLVHNPDLDEHHVLSLFSDWQQSGHLSVRGYCFDIGGTTQSGIQNWRRSGSIINNTDPDSAGNGGIMRLAPAAMASWHSAQCAADLAVRQSQTTHGSTECVDAAEFMAHYLVNLYQGQDVRPDNTDWCNSIRHIALTDYASVSRDSIRSSGYVVDTLEAAVWALHNSDSFETCVLMAVNLGLDADTVGAVAGQLAGAQWGLSSIPERWVKQLTWSDLILTRAKELYQIGENRISGH